MTTLAADVSATQERVKVSDMPNLDYFQVDDEIFRVSVQRPQSNELLVQRGYAGTTAATHSSGATLTPVYVPSSGGGGGGLTNPVTSGLVIYPESEFDQRLTIGGGTDNDISLFDLDFAGGIAAKILEGANSNWDVQFLGTGAGGTYMFRVRDNDGASFAIRADGSLRMQVKAAATSAFTVYDSNGVPVFQVNNDGSVHIKTGTSLVADL